MQGFVPHLYQKLLNNTVKIFSFIEFFMPAIEIFLRRNFLLHFQHFLFQPILALQEGKSNREWTRLRREGSEGSEGSKGSEGKVLKMDGPSAQGFLGLTGPLAPRVVVSPSRAMSIIMPPFGGHVHIECHNHSYHRPPLRHFVALFP